mgnify:CR=1 FL=1|jgi:uncharacterized protein YeeX (DUF496 family)
MEDRIDDYKAQNPEFEDDRKSVSYIPPGSEGH